MWSACVVVRCFIRYMLILYIVSGYLVCVVNVSRCCDYVLMRESSSGLSM